MISKPECALVRSCFRAGKRVIEFAIRLAIGAAIREHDTTLGEKRVGIGFSPSGDNTVSQIKRLAADFIDRVSAIEPAAFEDPGEVGRRRASRRRADHERKAPPRRPCCGLDFSPSDPRQSEAEGKGCAHAERLLSMAHAYCQIRGSWPGWVRGRSMRNTLQRIAAEMRALQQAEEHVVNKPSVTLLAVLDYAARARKAVPRYTPASKSTRRSRPSRRRRRKRAS